MIECTNMDMVFSSVYQLIRNTDQTRKHIYSVDVVSHPSKNLSYAKGSENFFHILISCKKRTPL